MGNAKEKLLILVDASSYLFRAYHALPPLTNSQGVPTGAVYGVISMLKRLIKDYESDYIGVVFDPKGKTTRHEWYPQYKAHRPVMPEELQLQIEPLHRIIKAMGLPLIIIDGIEADDVIGTLSQQAMEAGFQVIISTGDKDMAQLVNDSVTLINTMNNSVLNSEGVEKKFGVRPDQIIDYLALMGDSVDNIPGINKVGPKTAAKWLGAYGSIKNLIDHANEISGKIGEALREGIPGLALSQKLTTIQENLALNIDIENLRVQEKNNKELQEIFEKLEFKTWLADINKLDINKNNNKEKKEYEIVLTEERFNIWLEKLNTVDLFAFDTETTGSSILDAKLVGISFAVKTGQAAYVPVGHDYIDSPKQLSLDFVLSKLKLLLENKNKIIIGHNLKSSINIFKNYNIFLKARLLDIMLESYVLNSTSGLHDVASLSRRYLNYTSILEQDIAGKASKKLTFDHISLDQAAPYAAEKADIILQLHASLWPKLGEPKGKNRLRSVLRDIELPLMPILAEMESQGVLIDVNSLREQSISLEKRMIELEKNIYEVAGCDFNINSPLQLQEILYDKLKLPVLKKTPTGRPSTSEDVLQELSFKYALPQLILDFRSLSKLKSTYTDSLPQQVHPKTGRVHCSYNQAVTATGRLSSTDPNLQNIPIRKKEGQLVRRAFIASPGCKIVTADYSQIELRIMAHFSQDSGLLSAFAKHSDIHSATAAEVFSVPLGQVTLDQRRSAKAINFGLIYGMSAFGLAKQLGVGRNVAQEYMDVYFARYPKVRDYMEETRQQAREQGYVETLRGRRLYLPDIRSQQAVRRHAAERAAINAPMQGTAADIIKLAMIHIEHWVQEVAGSISAVLIMQVHDELVFEVKEEDVPVVVDKIKYYMANAERLDVPLVAEIGVGDNWQAAHP